MPTIENFRLPTFPHGRCSPRHGIALILSLIILASLLLLGVPFLFSQSSSLAGSRSFAYHQSATVGREAVEQYATAAVALATAAHLQATTAPGSGEDAVVLADNLSANGFARDQLTSNQLALIPPAVATANAAQLGVMISDEHAKLDPNHLDVAAWSRLIEKVLGANADWDDSVVWDSEDLNTNPATDDIGPTRGTGSPAALQSDNDDSDGYGELAEALSKLRFSLPGQHITVLEQLLLADPQHNELATAISSDYTTAAAPAPPPADGYGFRRPLTRSELAVLRPFLSVYPRSPGREGLIDLGSAVIANNGVTVMDSDLSRVIAPGTVVAWNDPTAATARPSYGLANSATSIASLAPPRGFAISAPPAVNLHHSEDAIGVALQVSPLSLSTLRYAGLASNLLPRLNPLASGRELPPIDIASWGLISLDAAATAHDPLGRMAASRSRRSVVQAVPQEGALERRWDAQDQFHAVLEQRFGNALDSWPNAVKRITGQGPDTATASAGTATGITAAVMPSLATGWFNRAATTATNELFLPTHLNTDWRVGVGAAAPLTTTAASMAFATVGDAAIAKALLPDLETFPLANVRPDGLAIDSGKRLGFQLFIDDQSNHGPLRSIAGGPSPNHELRARHLSFWIKPDQDNWNITANQIVPLIETRMPMANAGTQANGDPGHNELQNQLGLYYDSAKQCLVLVIAPPIIEHTNDGPLAVSGDIFRTPNDDRSTFSLDERSLGNDSGNLPLFPAQPGSAALLNESSATFTQKVSRLYKPNRIVTLCRVANLPDGRPFFRKDRWCHIMLVLGGTAPGMNRIIVDGLTGRDVNGSALADASQMQTGDHITLPAMPLDNDTDLPFIPVTNGTNLLVPQITVKNVLGLTATDLFPARGMLRIGDEYIWYDSISSTPTTSTFLNCSRAHRQNTNVNGAPTDYWPGIQQHQAGDLVVPGGYRLSLGAGSFYGGGCRLAYPLRNGDPLAGSARPWTIWSRIADVPPVTNHPSDPMQRRYPSNASTLPLDPAYGVPADFPLRGIVWIGTEILAYNGIVGTTLQNITDLTGAGWSSAPAGPFPARSDLDFFEPPALAPEVLLIGIPLAGPSPLDPGRYDVTPNGTDPFVMQFQHRDTGRIEWIQYEQLLFNGNGMNGFLLHRLGFSPSTRGQQRTYFRGTSAAAPPPDDIFPEDSPALPVQAEISGLGRFVASGDVVTLLPKVVSAILPPRPRQVLVRYAAMDGYDATGGNAANDTKNEYFAFAQDFSTCTELLGAAASDYDLLVWPGWGGVDLTPVNPQSHPTCQLPRIDLLGASYDPNQARCFFGALDPLHFVPLAPADDALRAKQVDATIDAVVAGNLQGLIQAGNTVGTGIIRVVRGPTVLQAKTDDITIGDIVEASYDGFFQDRLGLVAIGGETYAWRQPTTIEAQGAISTINSLLETAPANSQRLAVIIGRGLLDTDLPHQPHGLGQGPLATSGGSRFQRGLIPAVQLPLGPLAILEAPMPTQNWFRLIRGYQSVNGAPDFTVDNRLDAPAALVCAPDGLTATSEIIGVTVPTSRTNWSGYWYSSAPWLRGMYNTPAGAGGQAAGDLVIGWWPRYPSALPAAATAEHFRCRQYGWAGFPIAFQQARFDLVQTATGLPTAEVTEHNTGTTDLFTVEYRAAATGMDWTAVPMATNAAGAFAHSQFVGTPVSGAELRVTWHYKGAPLATPHAIAEAANRTPRFGPVRLRCLAPCAVLAVEEAK